MVSLIVHNVYTNIMLKNDIDDWFQMNLVVQRLVFLEQETIKNSKRFMSSWSSALKSSALIFSTTLKFWRILSCGIVLIYNSFT